MLKRNTDTGAVVAVVSSSVKLTGHSTGIRVVGWVQHTYYTLGLETGQNHHQFLSQPSPPEERFLYDLLLSHSSWCSHSCLHHGTQGPWPPLEA